MSVFKRKENGKWRVQFYYRDSQGKRCVISKTARTRREALVIEASLRSRTNGQDYVDLTMEQVCLAFLKSSERRLRKSTISNYEKSMRLHIVPILGQKKMKDITALDIDLWKEKVRRSGNYKQSYFDTIFKAISKAFRFARTEFGIYNNAIERSGKFMEDPNALPKEKDPLHIWTMEQFDQWMDVLGRMIENSPSEERIHSLRAVRLYVAIMMLSGLRKGEANALYIRDFHDGEYPYLSVTKSLNEKIKGIPYLLTAPKTRKSIRDVPIPKRLAGLIREHIEFLKGVPYFDRDLFFLCGGPKPISDTNAQKIKNKAEEIAGIPHIRIHDLRHSYVSLLINSRVDIAVIATLVGHSTPTVTMKVYSHLYPKTKNAAIEMLDGMLEKKGGDSK